jgi:hypothetical protein
MVEVKPFTHINDIPSVEEYIKKSIELHYNRSVMDRDARKVIITPTHEDFIEFELIDFVKTGSAWAYHFLAEIGNLGVNGRTSKRVFKIIKGEDALKALFLKIQAKHA